MEFDQESRTLLVHVGDIYQVEMSECEGVYYLVELQAYAEIPDFVFDLISFCYQNSLRLRCEN